jgi:hypothetical protein
MSVAVVENSPSVELEADAAFPITMSSSRFSRARTDNSLASTAGSGTCGALANLPSQGSPLAEQLEQGLCRLHFSFFDLQNWHETGSCRGLFSGFGPLAGIVEWNLAEQTATANDGERSC